MSWASILVAALAVPVALVDRRIAVAMLVAALALALTALARGKGRWSTRIAIGLTLAVGAFVGWSVAELHRPAPDRGPDVAKYQRPAEATREVLLPLTVSVADVKALALLEFTEGAHEVYDGFEPQLIDRGHERGYRVIAYRRDGYVDWYDDPALTIDPAESSAVTRKGRRAHVHADLGETGIEVDEHGRARIVVEFTDLEGRDVSIRIQEETTRRSVPTNVLAPIGWSSTQPDSFPLFIMDGFEFIRANSDIVATIDGKDMPIAPFPAPVPLQGQLRSGAKYTLAPRIVEVFPTNSQELRRVSTQPGSDVFEEAGIRYLFDGPALEAILVEDTEITFTPPLDVASTGEGRFQFTSYPWHGTISGRYRVGVEGSASTLQLGIDDVEVPHQRDLMYRLIVNERTVFGQWPKAYRYEATINRDPGTIDATWFNDDPESP